MNQGLGTVAEFEDAEELGAETLDWLNCRSKVVPVEFGNDVLKQRD